MEKILVGIGTFKALDKARYEFKNTHAHVYDKIALIKLVRNDSAMMIIPPRIDKFGKRLHPGLLETKLAIEKFIEGAAAASIAAPDIAPHESIKSIKMQTASGDIELDFDAFVLRMLNNASSLTFDELARTLNLINEVSSWNGYEYCQPKKENE